MAKDVITRFKLETTQYDSKLKSAAKQLTDFSRTAQGAGRDFANFTKANIEAAKSFGSISTATTSTKEKLKELVIAYNEARKAYEELSREQRETDWAKALANSLDQLKGRIRETKEEMYGMGNQKGGMFSGEMITNMMSVFGGNLLSKGVGMLASELTGTVQQSMELARQGEGIRAAFEKLNRPDLLDKLKEATHGTVSELDLMKNAVKFDNFGLSLDQMGTLLAFAQQQAKDTGQSVDYMVDSIVTGLGRKSLPILDNLGLSATEIRERMKESGDMTTAVADIIRDRMEKAGGYVETAADRAARATAQAQDKAEAFGREALPIAEEWAKTWATLSQGAMSFAQTLLGPVARSIRSIQGILNSDPEDRITGSKYNIHNGYNPNQNRGTGLPQQTKKAPGGYVEVTDKNGNVLHAGHFDNDQQKQNMLARWNTTTSRRGGSRTTQSIEDMLFSSLNKQQGRIDAGSLKSELEKEGAQPSALFTALQTAHYAQMPQMSEEERKAKLAQMKEREKETGKKLKGGEEKEKGKSAVEVADQINGGISNMVSSLEQMGIEMPEGFKSVLGGIQGMIGVLQSISMIVQGIEAMQQVGTFLGIFNRGGIVPHAAQGYYIGGTHQSGDVTPVLANAGELVLNKAQQGNLASQLQGGGMQNLQLSATVRGEDIQLALNNRGRRTGRGEYVQSTSRR